MKTILVIAFRKPKRKKGAKGESPKPECVYVGQRMTEANDAFNKARESGEFVYVATSANPRWRKHWRSRTVKGEKAKSPVYHVEAPSEDIPDVDVLDEDAEEIDFAALADE